jgi:spore maturation protein CgeB
MSYKFVKISTIYSDYLKDFYLRYPESKKISYQEHYKRLTEDSFAWSNFFEINLRKQGIEAFEIFSNATYLQNSWAKENGIKCEGFEIVLEQLKKIKPDVILFEISLDLYSIGWIKKIKEKIPTIRQLIGWCCAPYSENLIPVLKTFDYILTCNEGFLKKFKQMGIKAFRLDHPFEPSILQHLDTKNNFSETDLFFSGQLIHGKGFHNERILFIQKLLNLDIKMRIHSKLEKNNFLLAKQLAYLTYGAMKKATFQNLADKLPIISRAKNWNEFPKSLKYPGKIIKNIQPPLYGIEMYKSLSKSKIGFNIHAEIAGKYACNMRMFEVTGVGSCLLTDHKKNIREFFEPDFEVVTYKNIDEAIEKIKWLVANPKQCNSIAQEGQKRTLKSHNFFLRSHQLNQIILNNLN